MSEILLDKFLDVFKTNILPLTSKGVGYGNKIFGAAIIKKEDYSLIVAGTNNEIENPMWHGEISTLKNAQPDLAINFLVGSFFLLQFRPPHLSYPGSNAIKRFFPSFEMRV